MSPLTFLGQYQGFGLRSSAAKTKTLLSYFQFMSDLPSLHAPDSMFTITVVVQVLLSIQQELALVAFRLTAVKY